jgi:FlaA1/EpsC-like NDP-sugar epimerase
MGTLIMGARVLGTGKDLGAIAHRRRIEEVIISIATPNRKALAEIVKRCEDIPLSVRIVPTLQEIIEGRVSISHLRKVRVEDLLGRDKVEISSLDDEVRQAYSGKRILVTGCGGSIGSELVRQLLCLEPQAIAVLDKDENSVYELTQELAFTFPSVRIEPQIADLRHRGRLRALIADFNPEVVFHAAAHKHVPLMERNRCEAVLNNVGGTRVLLETCAEYHVGRFVFISTDKAVNPTSVMGATKRVGEMLVQSRSNGSLSSVCVRFGNVLGSRGSIIPLFQKQIAGGGPVTVTHPDVVRFFMTIPEAVQLVLCAATLGRRGEVFVLDMGNPRSILRLAEDMIRLSGLEPGRDIKIAITGLRPGEKVAEELLGPGEELCPTRFEKVSMIVPQPLNDRSLESVGDLVRAAQENDTERICELLSSMRLGFHPRSDENGEALPLERSPSLAGSSFSVQPHPVPRLLASADPYGGEK